MTRKGFIEAAGSAAVLSVVGRAFAGDEVPADTAGYEAFQREIDEITPQDFRDYLADEAWDWFGLAKRPAFRRLDEAFDRVLEEVKKTVVTDRPAVWLVYNMGVIVKTKKSCFSIDLMHRKAPQIAPLLDFALITHNHRDHYTEEFYRAMDGAGKTVISNFKDNYGGRRTKDGLGGYTHASKTFKLKDVEIRTSLADHNDYLVDFTTVFEIRVGDFTIYHSGDCSNVRKLDPARRPDLWIVHPCCGMKTEGGVKRFNPKLTVVAHLNELGHARDRWRWTWADGLNARDAVRKAGGEAVVPVWGNRIL